MLMFTGDMNANNILTEEIDYVLLKEWLLAK